MWYMGYIADVIKPTHTLTEIIIATGCGSPASCAVLNHAVAGGAIGGRGRDTLPNHLHTPYPLAVLGNQVAWAGWADTYLNHRNII